MPYVNGKRVRPEREALGDDWRIVQGEYSYAPPLPELTEAQIGLYAFWDHMGMPADVSDSILHGRDLEELKKKDYPQITRESDMIYEYQKVLWKNDDGAAL